MEKQESQENRRTDDMAFEALPWYKKAIIGTALASILPIFATMFTLIGLLWDRTGFNNSANLRQDSEINRNKEDIKETNNRVDKLWIRFYRKTEHEE